jgi:hypothetical protein
MIERKKVKCPIGTRPYTEMCLDHRSLYCSTCKKGVCAELDPDFIARLQSIIEQQEVSIKAYKRLAKRWMKMAKWLTAELAASKQENGNLFDRLRIMAQEVLGRDSDIERLETELAIEREPLTVARIVAGDLIHLIDFDALHIWLEEHEYDGLWNETGEPHCGCSLDDFCPDYDCPQPDCRPAFKHSDGMMYVEKS